MPETFPKTVEECNDRYNRFTDLQDFLDHYYIGMGVLITENDFYDLAMDYFTKAHSDGCLHSEVFFDPQGHVERNIDIDVVVQGFNRACKDANTKYGTTNKLIMCLLRHLPAENGLQTIHSASKYYQDGIIHGLGLDSVKTIPTNLFTECYAHIKDNFPEVGLTAHAGEEGDHTFVSDALNLLKVSRIDHGVNSHQSEELMKRLAEQKLYFHCVHYQMLNCKWLRMLKNYQLTSFPNERTIFNQL